MKRSALCLFAFVSLVVLLPALPAAAQKRRVVVRRPTRVVVRRPVTRTRVVVHPGHPIRRAFPATVIVRPAHRAVVVTGRRVFLPPVAWRSTIVALPTNDRLVWQDSETIENDEGWVDTNFGIDESGNALYLDINGDARLNFGEVTFANGNVQVVDFNEQAQKTGIYKLLDFADGRHVKTVRLLAKSETERSKLVVYLSK